MVTIIISSLLIINYRAIDDQILNCDDIICDSFIGDSFIGDIGDDFFLIWKLLATLVLLKNISECNKLSTLASIQFPSTVYLERIRVNIPLLSWKGQCSSLSVSIQQICAYVHVLTILLGFHITSCLSYSSLERILSNLMHAPHGSKAMIKLFKNGPSIIPGPI
jgi:hypothetical protein